VGNAPEATLDPVNLPQGRSERKRPVICHNCIADAIVQPQFRNLVQRGWRLVEGSN